MAAYCGSKFAMLGFSESLSRELKETGVKVSVISPIGVKTNFFNNEYFDFKFPMKYMLDPQKVSKAVLRSITSNSFQTFVPTIAGLSIPFRSCFPSLTDLIIEHQFRKM
jgi:short-subunit dehydrogenase